MFFYVEEVGSWKLVRHFFKYEMETNGVWNHLTKFISTDVSTSIETVEQTFLQLMLLETKQTSDPTIDKTIESRFNFYFWLSTQNEDKEKREKYINFPIVVVRKES